MSIEHTYRICEEEFTKIITKAKAIRAKCLDCSSGYQGEVYKCTVPTCPLFPFRFGNEKGLERMEHLKEGYVDPELEDEKTEESEPVEKSEKQEPKEETERNQRSRTSKPAEQINKRPRRRRPPIGGRQPPKAQKIRKLRKI